MRLTGNSESLPILFSAKFKNMSGICQCRLGILVDGNGRRKQSSLINVECDLLILLVGQVFTLDTGESKLLSTT